MKYNRATIPQRVIDLLFSDDGFYNEVVASKKVVVNKYPRSDQWVDESGLNISFALAGYSGSDIDAVRSVQLVLSRLADAINEGRHGSNEQRGGDDSEG